MKDDHSQQTVALMFSELAWLLLFGVILTCGYLIYQYKQDSDNKDLLINKLRNTVTNYDPNEINYHVNEIAALKQKIKNLEIELEKAEARISFLEKENQTFAEEIENLSKDIERLNQQLQEVEEKNKELLQSQQQLLIEIASLKEKIRQQDEIIKDLREQLNSSSSVRKELLGLKGPMKNVVFVMDKSKSMERDERWNKTCEIVELWVTHLNVERCILVLFSNNIKVVSGEGIDAYLDMRGDERQNSLDVLQRELKAIEPIGQTNTYKALEKAYSYSPDTIVLFTDGAPAGMLSFTGPDKRQMDAIRELCNKEDIPVNVVAIGDYFDRDLCTFLRDIAELTKGSFNGK